MRMGTDGIEAGGLDETRLHYTWQMDVVLVPKPRTCENGDGRWASSRWMLMVVHPTAMLILGARPFAEKPRPPEIAAAFEEIRAQWDDRSEPDDSTPCNAS